MIVIKLGGSLFDEAPGLLNKIKDLDADILVVPGGGEFANIVRDIDRKYSLSDDAAHWMAILAMNEYAFYLSDKTGIPLRDSISSESGVRILLPYEMIKENDELPHSWDVTSDTIAAWIAHMAGARLIKATDVDGIFVNGKLLDRAGASDIKKMKETCVDLALPGYLIKYGMDVTVVNGHYPQRVIDAIDGKMTIGTVIEGK
ncbi:amino acid kinase [Methanocella sp. CWC-04]|uniref:Amino acid kinase n=1 Tax=Methanooceanicella nereidis TaxID=2052831 RepID=A0AAP2RG43_9EURY|nr:amino acid kinase [Methanocella sp. CWC-04]MCD1296166.1 amino acid kinase [Methanocella sp. CWC-04]